MGQQTPSPGWVEAEDQLERAVSQHIRAMSVLLLAVPTRPDGSSHRAVIERNSIALLSCATGSPDTSSPGCLGHHASSSNVRRSGLWNSNHIDEIYQPGFWNSSPALRRTSRLRRPGPTLDHLSTHERVAA
jgi:hypothetical protein